MKTDWQPPDGCRELAEELSSRMAKDGFEEWMLGGVASRSNVDRLLLELAEARMWLSGAKGDRYKWQREAERLLEDYKASDAELMKRAQRILELERVCQDQLAFMKLLSEGRCSVIAFEAARARIAELEAKLKDFADIAEKTADSIGQDDPRTDCLNSQSSKANTPFDDRDPRINIRNSEHNLWFEYQVRDGGWTGPFQTWREAYRAAEATLILETAIKNADIADSIARASLDIENALGRAKNGATYRG